MNLHSSEFFFVHFIKLCATIEPVILFEGLLYEIFEFFVCWNSFCRMCFCYGGYRNFINKSFTNKTTFGFVWRKTIIPEQVIESKYGSLKFNPIVMPDFSENKSELEFSNNHFKDILEIVETDDLFRKHDVAHRLAILKSEWNIFWGLRIMTRLVNSQQKKRLIEEQRKMMMQN